MDLKKLKFNSETLKGLLPKGGSLAPNPLREWFIILSLSTLFLVGVVAFSVYLFFVHAGDTAGSIFPSEEVVVEAVERELLHQAIAQFEAQATQFSELKESPPSAPDPSL